MQPVQEVNVQEIEVPALSLERLRPIIGPDRYHSLRAAATRTRQLLDTATVWNVSSTARGGGVAEMLYMLVGYIEDAGVNVRWGVIQGDAEFFAITKRVHNRLHGTKGDEGHLGAAELQHYEQVAEANAAVLAKKVLPGDVVVLHDPQTAGLGPSLRDVGAIVIWRCHIGTEAHNDWTEQGWRFLQPYLDAAVTLIFSRRGFAPAHLDGPRVAVIPPSIDPFSPKNHHLSRSQTLAILERMGLVDGDPEHPEAASFVRRDGTTGEIRHRAAVVGHDGPLDASTRTVVQVSRWDRLKDMVGVMRGFGCHVAGRSDAHLVLVGPAAGGVTDDPEGSDVFAECIAEWEDLPTGARRRVRLVTLPMDDLDENAVMVNAIQRHANLVVQKSLVEGFGLTVSEAMWKSKPVVASAVGGITDQVAPGTGVLLRDPTDLDAFGKMVAELLARPEELRGIGTMAHRRVTDEYLGDRHLLQYAALLQRLLQPRPPRR